MTIRINPIIPPATPPAATTKNNPAEPAKDKGAIVNAKNVDQGKLRVRRTEINNGVHKALVNEDKKYI